MSLVNTFRVVFNECFDAEIELLPDRSYYSYTQLWPYWPPDATEDVSPGVVDR